MGLGSIEGAGGLDALRISDQPVHAWRVMFVLGTVPALLAILIRRRLKEPERWKAVAPVFNTGKIRVPVLFQMPEMEARKVPELYSRLARAGTPTELYAFPGAAHIKIQPRQRVAVYERNFDWFRYWLEDVRDPAPAKAAQYRRWDALRSRWRERPAGASSGSTAPEPQAR